MFGRRLIGTLGIGVLVAALCASQDPPGRTPPGYPDLPAHITDFNARAAIIRLERVHGGVAWQQRDAVQFKIETTLAGEKPSAATVLFERTTGRVRMEMPGNAVIIFDGAAMWASAEEMATKQAARDAANLPFLLMAPLRLRDAAFDVTTETSKRIGIKRYETVKAVTKDSAADPWYLIFEDAQSRLVGAVLYEASDGDGKAARRLAQFDSFDTVEGITVPIAWKFFNWTERDGITGDAIGTATISDVMFPVPADDAFTPAEDAVKIAI